MVSARTKAVDPPTGSLWRHGGRKRMGVVRVEGVQPAMLGRTPTVLVADGVRGAMPLRFGARRAVDLDCFRRRYRSIVESDATVWARGSERRVDRRVMQQEAVSMDKGQVDMGVAESVAMETQGSGRGGGVAWTFDAVVLNAGIGGASHGLSQTGLRVVGVDEDPEAARAHCANVSHCAIAEPLGWRPPAGARAKLVFYALPESFPREEMPEANRNRIPDEDEGVTPAERAKIIAAWPRRHRLADAFRVASELGAQAVIVEVSGGRRGKDDDYEFVRDMAVSLKYRAFSTVLDAAFLGLPQIRLTRVVIALRVSPTATPPKWPKMTHAASHNVGGLEPYRSVRMALGLDETYLHEGPDSVTDVGVPRLNVEAPCPTIGPKGVAEKLVARGADGHPLAPRSVTADEVRALQGLPASFTFGGVRPTEVKKVAAWERTAMRQVATAFPPVLARALATSVLSCLDADRAEIEAAAKAASEVA